MKLKFSIPAVRGRGAGLGNELITWSRAFLIAQALDINLIHPAWGLNSRQYWRHFSTSRFDWILNRGIESILPKFEFTEKDYLNGGSNLSSAIKEFAIAHDLFERRAYAVVTQGMWGGYHHISDAREFILATLYNSRFAARNLLKIKERLNPDKYTVGIHVRLGDFSPSMNVEEYKNRFNVALPLSWYCNIAKSIQQQMGDKVQFLIASDGTKEQLAPLVNEFDCILTNDIPDSDCSDLLALSRADLLICSVSSFSAWAAFLSNGPYIWYKPNLNRHDGGFLSIWGHEPQQMATTSPTNNAIEVWKSNQEKPLSHSWAVDHEGNVPEQILNQMITMNLATKKYQYNNLIQYGVLLDYGLGT